ncbi:hydantoinase B/oxoprolinase family protein [Roseomonas chloroacetimidivorans]|uniref:hydantoinase B/oxoprolinase family protein n=1 Tax=Roseomonas chloroacetimidivorans TaxID=1766656 RepID=UPI003C742C84
MLNPDMIGTIDPVTFEVLNHRFMTISEEMGIQYMRCSGSNVLITGNDAASAIMLGDGGLVSVGPYIVTQGNVLPLIVDSTLKSIGPGEVIEDGDIFICNDPYLGAIHHPDIATVAPVFWEGRLVAWVGASGHQLDNGGMDPGGFSIKVVDTHQEGLRMPPVKIVSRGVVREDILRWIRNQVRDPLVALDIKGQIASLNSGRQRVLELFERWGERTVISAMHQCIDHAREKLEERLAELPDGTWREVQYIDHDGHTPAIYKIVCTLTKVGSRLKFDFTGTSPNARGLINCSYAGLQAACLTATYLNCCWDIAWNRGVRDCMDIVSEVGTVNNCAYPAPCAMATISAVIVTIDATWRCLSQMILASGKYREEAMACWSGTSMAPIFAGTSQHGFPFAATEMSHFGGGGGASFDRDGVDTAGIVFNTTPNMPNVEDQEAEYPVLYLFRRHLRDSGGPGKFRGGRSGELAYTIYDAPEGQLEGLFAGTGAEMPNAIGISGGMPGSAISIARVVQTDIARRLEDGSPLPDSLSATDGTIEWLQPKHTRSPILAGDVWYHSWQGGGGYGDPLLRAPELVADDVARGAVSNSAAADIYGVALSADGMADLGATEAKRDAIRAARKAMAGQGAAASTAVSFPGPGRAALGTALVVDGGEGAVSCGHCGERICGTQDNLYAALGLVEAPLTAAGPVRGEAYHRGRFKLRQFICRSCGNLTDVQVGLDGAPFSYAMPVLG